MTRLQVILFVLLCSVPCAVPVYAEAPSDEAPVFTYSPAKGLGSEKGIMRRDPSDIIKVGNLYYVWYTKGHLHHGYDATIWYATSEDGRKWTEKGEMVPWGIQIGRAKDSLPFLERYDCDWNQQEKKD